MCRAHLVGIVQGFRQYNRWAYAQSVKSEYYPLSSCNSQIAQKDTYSVCVPDKVRVRVQGKLTVRANKRLLQTHGVSLCVSFGPGFRQYVASPAALGLVLCVRREDVLGEMMCLQTQFNSTPLSYIGHEYKASVLLNGSWDGLCGLSRTRAKKGMCLLSRARQRKCVNALVCAVFSYVCSSPFAVMSCVLLLVRSDPFLLRAVLCLFLTDSRFPSVSRRVGSFFSCCLRDGSAHVSFRTYACLSVQHASFTQSILQSSLRTRGGAAARSRNRKAHLQGT